MAGKNKILAEGTQLFTEGDESNGMYLVRRGEILVYLDKGNTEIPLVTITDGAMIGEMALFDKKPRSASARTLTEVEVSFISNEDFSRILKQIPKWFVSLMGTLSSRLRATNLKLEELEESYNSNFNVLDELNKVLNVLDLLWYKIGEKDGKLWTMDRDDTAAEITNILSLPAALVKNRLTSLVDGGLLGTMKNSYKKTLLTIQNRGAVNRFIEFVAEVKRTDDAMRKLPQAFVDIAVTLEKLAEEAPYDEVSVSPGQVIKEAAILGLDSSGWKPHLMAFKKLQSAIEIKGQGKEFRYKIDRKKIGVLVEHMKLLYQITNPQSSPSEKALPKTG